MGGSQYSRRKDGSRLIDERRAAINKDFSKLTDQERADIIMGALAMNLPDDIYDEGITQRVILHQGVNGKPQMVNDDKLSEYTARQTEKYRAIFDEAERKLQANPNSDPEEIFQAQKDLLARGDLFRMLEDSPSGITAMDLVKQLASGSETRLGTGMSGDGLYTSGSLRACADFVGWDSLITHMALKPTAKVITYADADIAMYTEMQRGTALGNALQAAYQYSRRLTSGVWNNHSHDPVNTWALLNGYDAVQGGRAGVEGEVVVLRRDALMMSRTVKKFKKIDGFDWSKDRDMSRQYRKFGNR